MIIFQINEKTTFQIAAEKCYLQFAERIVWDSLFSYWLFRETRKVDL